jgi:hypothetical protein
MHVHSQKVHVCTVHAVIVDALAKEKPFREVFLFVLAIRFPIQEPVARIRGVRVMEGLWDPVRYGKG